MNPSSAGLKHFFGRPVNHARHKQVGIPLSSCPVPETQQALVIPPKIQRLGPAQAAKPQTQTFKGFLEVQEEI